ncbi:MAG: MmgE/PrpD family protein [Comamonas sp.]|nr:MmgE/PrpD family protein [Comamonas sp.]
MSSDQSVLALADYVQGLQFAQLPPQAVHEARRRIIDSVACAAAAAAEPFCQQMQAMAARYAGPLSARLWGSGQTTSVEMAAFTNGTLLRYLDLSDTVLARSNGHPSDMLGGLVAVAEATDSAGSTLITAVVAAYEVYVGLCDAVAMAAKGVDQGTAAAVGTAAGAARLLGLDAAQTAHALSLCLVANVHLYNVRCGELSDWKGCGGPNGARNGVFAALMAQAGMTGPSAVVQGRGGLQTILGAFEWRVGQGMPLIASTHLKRHPVCYHGQSAVDAALALREQVAASAVQSIQIETYEAAYQAMGSDAQRWQPSNRETADHSLPYAVATAWLDGKLASSAYSTEQLVRADTKALMDRIAVVASPAMTQAFPAQAQTRISVTDAQGQVHRYLQPNPRGHAHDPMTDAELEVKFMDLFAPWGDEPRARHVLQTLWQVDALASSRELVDVLVATKGAAA